MLNVLHRFEPLQAREILAATALARSNEAPADKSKYEKEIEEVLNELRTANRISVDDNSIKAQSTLDRLISAEIMNVILAGRDLKSVKSDLGLRGDLPIGGYRIKIASEFRRSTKEKLNFVERCIRSADEIQHLSTDLAGEMQANRGVSLFAKKLHGRSGSEHWFIINALRIGDELTISAAWRVFPQAVDVENLTDPEEILRRFVETYGIEVEVLGVARGKFLQNVRLTGYTLSDDLDSYRIIHSDGPYVAVEIGALISSTDNDDLDTIKDGIVLMKYAIDTKKYRADVTRFGD